MKEIIKKFCENETENGLFLMDLPTGFGKTHNVIEYIFDTVLDVANEERKIFFITNLKKNLPEKKLRELFEKKGLKDLFEEKFLFLNSNAELAIEGFKKNPKLYDRVPKEIKDWDETKFFFQDLRDIVKQRNGKQNGFSEISSSLENTFAVKIERDFRHKIEQQLYSEFRKKDDRINAVLSSERWSWLGELYESTKTSKKQIIFLSAKKFVTKNDTIVESPYFFYSNDILEKSVVFIDEFDAAKKDFLDNIIEDGIREKIDFIDLFTDIHLVLNQRRFQKELLRKSKWYTDRKYGSSPVSSIIDGFKNKANEIADQYHLVCDIRTKRDQEVYKNFLFQDNNQFHTIANDRKFISVTHFESEDLNQIEISENETGENSYSIQKMLSKVRGFITFFQIGVWRLAYNLFRYRSENHIGDGDFTFEAALSSVLKDFRLKAPHISYLRTQILQETRKSGNDSLAKDYDLKFYSRGLRYYAFIDDSQNDLQSVIMMFGFNNTPEKILLNTCERAKVVGISATASIPTAIGNFNLDYLKEQLGTNFQEMSREDRIRLQKDFDESQYGYKDVKIHAELLGKDVCNQYDEEIWKNIFSDGETTRTAHDIVCESTPDEDKGFHKERYYRIVLAYKKFFENEDIHSFLCILTTHPKEYKFKGLNRRSLVELFSLIDPSAEQKVCWLKTENYDEDKAAICKRLSSGEKLFVVSAYATLGAGQNLQYQIPTRQRSSLVTVNNARRDNEKDFEAIYLDNPTNLLVNINIDKLPQKDFVRFLFQMEYLQANGEISPELMMAHVKRGFEAYSTGHRPNPRKGVDSVKNRSSVIQFATRDIIQAVGRICRTNNKSKNIYIYADSRIAENLDCSVANDLILNKEFKCLLNAVGSQQNKEIVRPSLQQAAENKCMSVNGFIKNLLKEAWSDMNIERWKDLREFALRNPTISKALLMESRKNSFYAELPKKNNLLFYSQKNDYGNVKVSFESSLDFPCVESAADSRLDRLMTHPKIKAFFESNGYKTSFTPDDYIMVPTMYNNIYKGALGEVVGKFLFSILFDGVELEEITDYTAYELFDFKVKDKPYYVDFKHWGPRTDVERGQMIEKIRGKAEKCGCEKALVINILDEGKLPCHKYDENRILAVPSLLSDSGSINANKNAVEEIRRFLAL